MLLRVRSETTGYVHALCLQFNSRSRCTLEDCDVACWSVCDDFILKDAQTCASQNKFEEAISKLTAVPEVCKECYDKAMDAVAPIYQKQIDRECKQRLMEATTAWNASQDLSSAESAGYVLSQIEPSASCYKEALSLSNQIAKRVKELDQREWKFQMKQQQDDVDIQKATIKAVRDIGVAYGNGPKATVVRYNVYGWW